MKTETLTLLIPVRNERHGIESIQPYVDIADAVIFIDGNSTDGTVAEIQKRFPNAQLIAQGHHLGKGSAIALGLQEVKTSLVMQVDADFPISPEEIILIKQLFSENPELMLVKPSRHLPGGGSEDLTQIRRFGALALARIARVVHKVTWTEVCYAMWTIRREVIPALQLEERILKRIGKHKWWLPYAHGFEFDQYVFFTCLKSSFPILEVPTYEWKRKIGSSSLFAPRDGLRTLWIILREFVRKE